MPTPRVIVGDSFTVTFNATLTKVDGTVHSKQRIWEGVMPDFLRQVAATTDWNDVVEFHVTKRTEV